MSFSIRGLLLLAACLAPGVPAQAQPRVVISEIMYHPVELPAFNPDGSPVLDLSDDVHEYVELHNPGSQTANLSGWRLAGGISFTFPAGTLMQTGQFLVVAKYPARIATVYGLNVAGILGPWTGKLDNDGDTVRLHDHTDAIMDAVSYSASSPWAISANALGAEDEYTGLSSAAYQYRGRSLERVSMTASANDPANWLASPLAAGPSPGRINSVRLASPRPVVLSFQVLQQTDGEPLIRASQPARVECTFPATNNLSAVSVEYFVDNIDVTNEVRTTAAMSAVGGAGEGRFGATLPGQADRSVVRFRVRGNRGGGVETISPRADDPFGWHAYFVSSLRSSSKPAYDLFVSQASLNTLSANITQSPRRVTLPDPPGWPRASWNATEPGIFVVDGVVRDIRVRYHGSHYSRQPGRLSMKWQFPRYHRFEGREGIFETDKLDYFIAGHGLFEAAGLPTSRLRHVDLYLNNNGALDRLEQEENDDFMLERYHSEQHALNPGQPREAVGEIYKCEGILPPSFEASDGPYGVGSFVPLPAIPPSWTALQRYEYTWALQDHGWKGAKPFKDMSEGFWAARGDSPSAPNPNLAAVRAWLEQNFDMDATLTYMAFREWGAAYDHITQNYFLWRRASGKWALLPWDFDDEYYEPFVNWSIYQGEVGDSNLTERGPNYLYDAIYKAFRAEYKERLFILNHTLLNPTNITALGFGALRSAGGGTMRGYADQRFPIVDQKLGLGVFQSPRRPLNVSPAHGAAALPPATLQASAYSHTASPGALHASTTWFIRAANGNYLAPIFRQVSTTNLTSISIPFDRLTFGETYFWKCLFTDARGHPSLESAETSFVFGSAPATLPLVAIDATTPWKFDQSGNPPSADWNQPSFNDGAWPGGPALLAQETCGCLPEPIRTTLTAGNKITFYFRARFVFPGPTAGVTLRLRQVIDDAVVIYLNGVEVSRSRLPAGPVTSTTLASVGIGDAGYEGPFTIPAAALVTGTNVLAAEVHQNAAGSSDVVFGLSLEASVPNSATGDLLINEILADNRTAVTNGETTPDFVEIYNATDLPQNLGGMSLSDDVAQPGRFVFPSETIIPPRGFLVVWCDEDTVAPGLHSGFGIDNDGQTLALFSATATGWQLGDHVTFGLQAPDFAIGRVADSWTLTVPTPGATNAAATTGPAAAALTINEWMASTTTGPDWFELFNSSALPVGLGGLYLSDSLANVTNTRIPNLSFIAPRGFRQFIADENQAQSARHVDFKLSANGEALILSDSRHTLIERITFGAQAVNVSQGRLPDGATNLVSFPGSASPDAANFLPLPGMVISEVLSHSLPPAQDEIELHNIGGAPLDIGGWWLSDEADVLQKYRITPNTVVPDGGFVVIHASRFTNGLVPFGLSGARGDEVFLSAADAAGNLTGARTSVKFGAAAAGVSQGRIPTSVGVDFGALVSLTLGGANAGPLVGPVVISEIHYHPIDLEGNEVDYEFIELQNITAVSVNLFDDAFPSNRWRLRDAVHFTFPSNTVLVAGERVLVVGFDPLTNAPALAAFRSVYGLPAAVRLFGPYGGRLGHAGASVELVRPDTPVSVAGPDFGFVPSLLVDRVHYSDHAPWPDGADGFGPSLQRRDLTAYGNEPTNWFAAGLSAGAPNHTNAAPFVVLTAPVSNAILPAGVSIALAASAADADGTVRRVEFFADGVRLGEDTSAPFTFSWANPAPGPHLLTARAFDDGLSSVFSTAVVITVTNQPPTVTWISPLNGAAFVLPTNILLQVAAADPDGSVQRVEYYDQGAKLGESTNAFFSLFWTNAGSGTHTLTARALDNFSLAATSAPVTITATRDAYIAYLVQPGTIGGQDYGGGIGMDFNVLQPVLVTRLGIFDSRGDGIANTLTAQLYNRTTASLLASMTFNSGSPGALASGTSSRFKPLATPLALLPGSYSIVGYGHNAIDRNGNAGIPEPKTWTTDGGGGLMSFVGVCRVGGSPGTFPTSPDTGPADRYASGTFEYLALLPPVIVRQPVPLEAIVGQSAALSVVAGGTPPLHYRWLRDGVTVSGQTAATLTLANAQAANAGNYVVIITNYAGSVTSAVVLLTVLPDGDHDGMPDTWEAAHGFNLSLDDAAFDDDGDGATNLQEYLAGTDPQDPSSYLKLIIANLSGPRLEFLAASNKTYTILWRPGANAAPWNKLTDISAVPTNRVVHFSDTGVEHAPQRFYRLATP